MAEGIVATVAVPPHTPYALDADVAELLLGDDVGEQVTSVDPVRRLFRVGGAAPLNDAAFDAAALAASAQLLGAGERMLADSGLALTMAADMADGAQKAVAFARAAK